MDGDGTVNSAEVLKTGPCCVRPNLLLQQCSRCGSTVGKMQQERALLAGARGPLDAASLAVSKFASWLIAESGACTRDLHMVWGLHAQRDLFPESGFDSAHGAGDAGVLQQLTWAPITLANSIGGRIVSLTVSGPHLVADAIRRDKTCLNQNARLGHGVYAGSGVLLLQVFLSFCCSRMFSAWKLAAGWARRPWPSYCAAAPGRAACRLTPSDGHAGCGGATHAGLLAA